MEAQMRALYWIMLVIQRLYTRSWTRVRVALFSATLVVCPRQAWRVIS